ncbi:DUF6171 family protein [Paenibacillus protaetiae]|uniref:Uncharacterized protein n=1 Tax=Paenibacillus protaetiae TaxID=2509456 RepID=A0A4P6EY90_9BACL|nr:DUF6171 family protein [Paenibacillus protaetiae]QAY68044.1 hypothetical protein ET464_18400 [Paenibacillus protaetiae]
MDNHRGCKGCESSYHVTDQQINRMLQAPMFQSPEHCVTDEMYQLRLTACSGCDKLMNGTTCLICGCIVQITAKLKARSCAKPGDDRWEAAAAGIWAAEER